MPNKLSFEASPYLQQHANDLVDWFPWCQEAFTKRQNSKQSDLPFSIWFIVRVIGVT